MEVSVTMTLNKVLFAVASGPGVPEMTPVEDDRVTLPPRVVDSEGMIV